MLSGRYDAGREGLAKVHERPRTPRYPVFDGMAPGHDHRQHRSMKFRSLSDFTRIAAGPQWPPAGKSAEEVVERYIAELAAVKLRTLERNRVREALPSPDQTALNRPG